LLFFLKRYDEKQVKVVATEMEKVLDQYNTYYSLEDLQDKDNLPSYIDLKNLEDYLTESDFPRAFGITKEVFFTNKLLGRS
jgi:hypothetical protein